MKFSEEMGIFAVATVFVITVLIFSGIVISESGCLNPDSVGKDNNCRISLLKYQGVLQNDLSALSDIARDTAVILSDKELSGADAQKALDSAQKQLPFIITAVTFDEKGYVKAVSPSSQSEIAGMDLSDTSVVSDMNKNMIPSMSNLFELAQGGSAAIIKYPVFSPKKEYRGFISLTFDPSLLIGQYASELMDATGYQSMAVQKDGIVLYDTDLDEIGKETFGNPMYDDYPEVLEFAKAYSQSFSGEYTYSYLDKGLDKTLDKKAFWTTFGLYGTEWRLICIREA